MALNFQTAGNARTVIDLLGPDGNNKQARNLSSENAHDVISGRKETGLLLEGIAFPQLVSPALN